MSAKLSDFVKKNYPDSKSDLFACFIECGNKMVVRNGFNCMVTMQSWMFLSSFEKMRVKILQCNTIANLMHMENMVMGIAFGTAVSVFRKNYIKFYKGTYNQIKLADIEKEKPKTFPVKENRFAQVSTDNFSKIPGSPVAYWVSASFIQAFEKGISIDKISDFTGSQHKTADNERFLRSWWEIDSNVIINNDWIFYIKGGEFRKWYGNIELVVDWRESARNFYTSNATSNMIKERYWFKDGITYTSLTSSVNGFRYLPPVGVDIKGPSIIDVQHLYYCLGFFNSKVAMMYMKLLNPTITLQVKDVKNTPLIIDKHYIDSIEILAKKNVENSTCDWDFFETSWDFKRHPLNRKVPTISEAFDQWQDECNNRFNQLKSNEEELNRIFIDIYCLQDELTPEVEDRDVTVRKADLQRDIKSFISYAVGCMFGRYSLDVDGLAYAGGEWENSKYVSFPADKDNIIPICDDEYFEDDIVGCFVKFVEVVYGADTLQENLKFIADALGGKGHPKDVIRNYFMNDFYKDHCKMYRKRPIYWLFDSGKKNGFKALIYMHRYQPDTIARIRTDYVHEPHCDC